VLCSYRDLGEVREALPGMALSWPLSDQDPGTGLAGSFVVLHANEGPR
jgi:hypothetical protein